MPVADRAVKAVLIVVVCVLAIVAVVLAVAALTRPTIPTARGAAEAVPASSVEYATFLGGSATQGAGASSPRARWVTLLAADEQWEPSNLARGGSGYLVPGSPAECETTYCPGVLEMLPTAIEARPDVVVVAAGLGDAEAYENDPAPVEAAIAETYDTLRKALPETRIVAVGPIRADTTGRTSAGISDAVRAAAGRVDAVFIDLAEPDVLASAPGLMEDGLLTDAGHAAIADRIADAIAEDDNGM